VGRIHLNGCPKSGVHFCNVVVMRSLQQILWRIDKDEGTSNPHNLTPLNTKVSQEDGRSFDAEWTLHKDVRTYCQNADLGHADAQTYIGDITAVPLTFTAKPSD